MTENSQSSTKVSIFGNLLPDDISARTDSDSSTGFFLIFVGILLFFNTTGTLSWEIWSQLFNLWPILIILAGLNILLSINFLTRLFLNLIQLIIFGSLLLYILMNFAPHLVSWIPQELTKYIQFWRLTNI